jgi:hypothetical protein
MEAISYPEPSTRRWLWVRDCYGGGVTLVILVPRIYTEHKRNSLGTRLRGGTVFVSATWCRKYKRGSRASPHEDFEISTI